MSALTRTPQNPNILHPNKYQLHFSRNPALQYFCQSVIVPGLSVGEIAKPTPFVETYSPGDKIIYDILNITFLIDEELVAWKEIHDWIRGMGFPTNFSEYANLPNIGRPYYNPQQPQFSSASLTLLSSANLPLYNIKFVDIFPISISSFIMSSTESPNQPITADAAFRYSWYDIEKLF